MKLKLLLTLGLFSHGALAHHTSSFLTDQLGILILVLIGTLIFARNLFKNRRLSIIAVEES